MSARASPPILTSDLGTLLKARRWVLVILSFVSIATFTLSLPLPLDPVPSWQRITVAGVWVLATVGTFLSTKTVGLWILTISMFLLFLTSVVGIYPWTQFVPLVAIFEAALFTVTLSSRAVGTVTVLAAAAMLTLLPADQATVLDVGGWEITTGMVRALQLILSGGFLLRAWPGMVARARTSDARRAEGESELAESLRTQERLHVWRDTAIRVHETILNDIRYVLSIAEVDRARLAAELGPRPRAGRLKEARGLSLRQVVEASVAAAGFPGEARLDIPPVRVAAHAAPYLRSALIEFVRNATRHADARTVTISASTASDELMLTCRSESSMASDEGAPGIGRSIVLDEAMAAVGGRVEVHGPNMTLWLPSSPRTSAEVADPRTDPGRIAVSGVLAGVAAGAFPYPLDLMGSGASMLSAASAVALFVLVMAVVVAARRPMLSTSAVAMAAILAAAVPILMWAEQSVCMPADSLAYVIDITGLALVAIAVWSRWRGGLLLLLPWAVTATLFAVISPSVSCNRVPFVALAASVLVGVFAPLVLDYTLRRSRRQATEARSLEESRVREGAQAEAALDLARTLDATVTAAWDVMQDIARGAELDSTRRDTLRRLEARIRATIQVDTRTSGAVTQLARDLVMRAAAGGRSMQVLSLRDSHDQRPIPDGIGERILAFVLASEREPSIQAFAFNGVDHLSVTGSGAAAARVGMTVDARWTEDGADVEVNGDEGAAGVVSVLLRRSSDG